MKRNILFLASAMFMLAIGFNVGAQPAGGGSWTCKRICMQQRSTCTDTRERCDTLYQGCLYNCNADF